MASEKPQGGWLQRKKVGNQSPRQAQPGLGSTAWFCRALRLAAPDPELGRGTTRTHAASRARSWSRGAAAVGPFSLAPQSVCGRVGAAWSSDRADTGNRCGLGLPFAPTASFLGPGCESPWDTQTPHEPGPPAIRAMASLRSAPPRPHPAWWKPRPWRALPSPRQLRLPASRSPVPAVRLHDSISEEGFHYLVFDL